MSDQRIQDWIKKIRAEEKAQKARAAAHDRLVLKALLFRALVRATIIVVFLFGALWLVAGFSERQSLVLAAIGGLVFAIFLWLQERPFVPYCVRVYPNVRSILTDLQLLKDTEEAWRDAEEVIEKIPHHYWNVWEYGFSVSFVTPELIYDNLGNKFRTKVEMRARLDPAGWGMYEREEYEDEVLDEIVARLLPEQISLYFQEIWCGYSLGVVLRKEYWEKVRHNAALKDTPEVDTPVEDPQSATVKVQLAVVPADEFIFYSDYAVMRTKEVRESAARRREEARARYGWNERQEKWPSADPSTVIEHRYYTVSHSAL